MYYISSKNGNKYGVTDTTDGVEEFYTAIQLRDLVLQGFRIKGCSYGSRDELKIKGFWSINVEERHKVIEIKVGRYYNFKFRDRWNGVNQCTGYCSKIDSSEYDFIYFILMDGNSIKVTYDNILEFKQTRGVNKSIKDLVLQRVNITNLIEQKTNQIDVLKQEIYQLNEKLKYMPAKFLEVQGQVTLNEFINIVIDNMDTKLKYELQSAGYKIEKPCMVAVKDNIIYFTRVEYVGNGRNFDFVYTEYDGTFHITSDAESNQSYKSYLKKYRKVICTSLPYQENLVLYEYKVMYQGWYKIILPTDKALTKDLAIQIGKSLK